MRGAQLKKKAQGQLYLYVGYQTIAPEKVKRLYHPHLKFRGH